MNNQGNKEMNSSNSANIFVDIDALVFGLEKEDDRNLKMTRNFRWFLVVMAVLYTLLMVVNPDPELKMHHRISGLCYVAAFTLFTVVFAKFNNEFRNVDYSLTSVEMLQQAAKRYKFLSWRYIWMLPSLLLIDAGISVTYFHRWISVEPLNRVLLVQVVFIPLMAISAFIGYLIWRKRQKPLHDSALTLLQELQGI
jgi:Ca2+/Na+ antiporter